MSTLGRYDNSLLLTNALLESKLNEARDLWASEYLIPRDLISTSIKRILEAFDKGNRIAFAGNGGSAADSMHIAAEFTGRCVIDHEPLPVMCLNESQSALTAISNDYGFERVFSRLIKAHLREGDILFLLSTSGKSKNISIAIEEAMRCNIEVILWAGENAPEFDNVEVWRVKSSSTPRIQEVHLFWGHLLAELVEENISRLAVNQESI